MMDDQEIASSHLSKYEGMNVIVNVTKDVWGDPVELRKRCAAEFPDSYTQADDLRWVL